MKVSDFFCPSFIAGALVSLAITGSAYVFMAKPYAEKLSTDAQMQERARTMYEFATRPDLSARDELKGLSDLGFAYARSLHGFLLMTDELKASGLSLASTPEDLAKVDTTKVDALVRSSMDELNDSQLRYYLNDSAGRFNDEYRAEMEKVASRQPPAMPTFWARTLNHLSVEDKKRLNDCRDLLNEKLTPLYQVMNPRSVGACGQFQAGSPTPPTF